MTYTPPEQSIPTLRIPSLDRIRKLHLIGIGGAGMGGIARLLLAAGIEVTGSDLKETPGLDELRGQGAIIRIGHRKGNVGDPDAAVVSSAIPVSNPERRAAEAAGLEVFARAQILAALGTGKKMFAVSGTHGKTTTTSMLATIFRHAGLDPTFVVGGDMNESGSGAGHGSGEIFVAEADESDGSFLLMNPAVAVITNVEEDHLDFYEDAEEIRDAFAAFASSAGEVVAGGDGEGARAAIERSGREALTFGLDDSNDVAVRPLPGDPGGISGLLDPGGGEIRISLPIPGVHNLLNAIGALLGARAGGVDPGIAAAALAAYSGVRRRFEYKGMASGAEFFDDYAHHPTEVAATLAASRAESAGRLVAVFQPHRYTRTLSMWRPLGESLANADLVVVTDVYGAGEEPIPGVSGKLLVDALSETGARSRMVYLPRRADVVRFLSEEAREGDRILTMGAGDITMVADETLGRIRGRG